MWATGQASNLPVSERYAREQFAIAIHNLLKPRSQPRLPAVTHKKPGLPPVFSLAREWCDLGRTEGAAFGGLRDFAEAFRTLTVSRFFGCLAFVGQTLQLIEWLHNQEENHGGDSQKRDERVQKITPGEREGMRAYMEGVDSLQFVAAATETGNKRGDEVFDDTLHDGVEGGTDDDGNCQIDHIAAQDKLSELF